MKKRCNIFLKALFIIFIFMISQAFCDGIIIPRPHPKIPVPKYLNIKFHRVKITINNQVATTEVDQEFQNPLNVDLEGDYIFPLPEEAAISSFQMEVNGKMVKGKVLDKATARKIYEKIVRQRKDPALLEYIGRNMFRAKVYPIPAKGTKRVKLKYSQTLKSNNGVVNYVYPLDTERFSPKPLKEVTLSINVKSKIPIKSFYSPSHKISISRKGEYQIKGSYEKYNVKPDKDFVLYYTLSKKNFGLNLLTHKEKDKKEGYFLMFISPSDKSNNKEILPKDVVFVLDRSGSMDDKGKMGNAKKALKFCLSNLNKTDKFNIVKFSDEVEGFSNKLVPATSKNIKKARIYTEDITPSGGTNIRDALLYAINSFKGNKNPRYIIFLTDGLPTVGVTDIGKIIKSIHNANKKRIRLFTFGVGYNVNTKLLDKLANDNRGYPEYVKPGEEMEIKISSFYKKISDPLLSDVKLTIPGVKILSVYPRELPDIFKGSQLTIVGKYKGAGPSTIKLTGKRGHKFIKYIYEDSFPKLNRKNSFIPRLWAIRRIGYLLEEIKVYGSKNELVKEIIKLSKNYGIITPYTSFLVEEPDNKQYTHDTSAAPAPVYRGGAPKKMDKFKRAARIQTGQEAVKTSQTISSYKQANSPIQQSIGKKVTIKRILNKTFYLKKGIWTDSKYKGTETLIKIKFGSDKYFKLIKNKKIAKYLSVGESVILVHNNKTYFIKK